MNKTFRSGFVTLVGRPNVGKSTLMNRLIGEKLAIISNKPQTTRNKIQGILTTDSEQIIFIDTPGIHEPKSKLGANMVKMAESALAEVDIVCFLASPKVDSQKIVSEADKAIAEKLSKCGSPVFLVINKIDTVSKMEILTIMDAYKELCDFKEIVPISALKGENTDDLIETIKKYLPLGPQYFPSDMVTDQPERFIVSEIIREKALYMLQEEIPHGIAVEISSLKKRTDKEMIDIEATIYCEKDSHKGMVIGKQGIVLKEIGTKARLDIQRLFSTPVNLQLWVKVKKDWRDSDFFIKNFGYKTE